MSMWPYAKDIYETVPARKMGREGEFYLWRVREFNRTQLSYPRQSRGFISVSPSKGQKHEAPEGADSHT